MPFFEVRSTKWFGDITYNHTKFDKYVNASFNLVSWDFTLDKNEEIVLSDWEQKENSDKDMNTNKKKRMEMTKSIVRKRKMTEGEKSQFNTGLQTR